MTLKDAAFVALVGMILLTVLLLAEFIRDVAFAIGGLIPASRVLRSLVYAGCKRGRDRVPLRPPQSAVLIP
jgi:hypothetical protein